MKFLKLLYIISLSTVVIMLLLIGYFVTHQGTFNPNGSTTVTNQALIEVENHSIVQLVIINRESQDINYKICTSVNNSTRCFLQLIRNGKRFTYRSSYPPWENETKEVILTVYKEDEAIPIETAVWHLKT